MKPYNIDTLRLSQFAARFCFAAFFSAGASTVFAQEVEPKKEPAVEEEKAEQEKIVKLNVFEVKDTKGTGYGARESISGVKTRQALHDIPGSIVVVPRDLIDDLAQTVSVGDALRFVASGIVSYVKGEQTMIRGVRGGSTLVDDVRDFPFASDQAAFDSYEVLKGPTAVLYGQEPAIFGLVTKNTKKPQPVFEGSIKQVIGSYDFMRTELDVTGPLSGADFAGGTFSYRFVAAYQTAKSDLKRFFDDRKVLFPTIQWNNEKTTVRVSFQHQNILFGPGAEASTFGGPEPVFSVYKGRPSEDEGYATQWGNFLNTLNDTRATVIHKFNDNWQSKLAYVAVGGNRLFDYPYLSGINFDTKILRQDYLYYWNDYRLNHLIMDNIGKYSVGKVDMQTSFGFNRLEQTNWFQTRTFLPGYLTIDISNPHMSNPGLGITGVDIGRPQSETGKTPITTSKTESGNYYVYQNFDFFDKRVLLSVGGAYVDVKSYNNAGAVTKSDEIVKRAGLVVKPIRNISLYYAYATTFRPQGGRDFDGNQLDNVLGIGNEFGIKASFWDDRLSFTADRYDLELKNLAVTGGINPNTGLGYSLLLGRQTSEGYDFDMVLKVSNAWQLIANYWSGDAVNVRTGRQLAGTVKESAAFWTRYEIPMHNDSKLAVGGGTYYSGPRYFGGLGGLSNGPYRTSESYYVTNLFATYTLKHWKVSLNIDNIFNEDYIAGAWSPNYANYGDKRSYKVGFQYRFK